MSGATKQGAGLVARSWTSIRKFLGLHDLVGKDGNGNAYYRCAARTQRGVGSVWLGVGWWVRAADEGVQQTDRGLFGLAPALAPPLRPTLSLTSPSNPPQVDREDGRHCGRAAARQSAGR